MKQMLFSLTRLPLSLVGTNECVMIGFINDVQLSIRLQLQALYDLWKALFKITDEIYLPEKNLSREWERVYPLEEWF